MEPFDTFQRVPYWLRAHAVTPAPDMRRVFARMAAFQRVDALQFYGISLRVNALQKSILKIMLIHVSFIRR